MENILVFGGNRFVGKKLVKKLIQQGYNVDIFNRSGTGQGNVIQGDRNIKEDLDKIDFTKYQTIVDMCLFFESQYDLIENRINEDTNYIFMSSGAADSKYSKYYGDYGHDKKQIEKRLSSRKHKVIRPSYIVGKGNHRPRLGYYANKIINREHIEIAGNGQNKINIVFVQDVVSQLIRLIQDKDRLYERCIITGTNIEVIDLIYKINQYIENGEVLLVQDDEKAIFPKNEFTFDSKYPIVDIDGGIGEYLTWFYNEGAKQYGYSI